mgnify:CR=1 FL=1
MRKHLLTFIFLAQSLVGFLQFTDSFSNNNFTNNYNWISYIDNFEVNTSFKLCSNDIVWMEVFSENGNVDRFKEVAILNQ